MLELEQEVLETTCGYRSEMKIYSMSICVILKKVMALQRESAVMSPRGKVAINLMCSVVQFYFWLDGFLHVKRPNRETAERIFSCRYVSETVRISYGLILSQT